MRKLFHGRAGMAMTFILGLVIATAATAGAASLITGKQIKDGTISSKDLSTAVRAQLKKAGVGGSAGLQGAKGDTGPKGDPGLKGDVGLAGPGAQSFDGQFVVDNQNRLVTTIGGMDLNVNCQVSGYAAIQISRTSADLNNIVGWGTTSDGTTMKLATPSSGDLYVTALGGTVTMDVVAAATAPGAPVRFVRFDVRVVKGAVCSYHAMVTPSTP